MAGRLGLTVLCAGVLAGTALAAAANPGDPQKRHNPADQAWAKAIRIHRADLGTGDWRVEQSGGDDSGAPKGCKDPNLSDLVETGEVETPDFSRNGSFVGSGAAVFQSERHATAAWNRIAKQPITRCLIDAFKQGMAGASTRIQILSSGPLTVPKLAPHFTASRIRLLISGPGGRIEGRVGYYLYGRGRVTALLVIVSFSRPLQPIPASLERKLAGLVAQRLHR